MSRQMYIEDFTKTKAVTGREQIVSALAPRYGAGVNSFWLWRVKGGFPSMNIVVNGDCASVHFFPKEGHPGLRSIGRTNSLPPNGATTFFATSLLEQDLFPNRFVIPFSVAQEASMEFFEGVDPPECIQWYEL